MFDNNKLGEIRPNQLITTFGPGAIVDAVKDSVTSYRCFFSACCG